MLRYMSSVSFSEKRKGHRFSSLYRRQQATLLSRHLLFIEKPLINLLSIQQSPEMMNFKYNNKNKRESELNRNHFRCVCL